MQALPFAQGDHRGVRALVDRQFGGTRYHTRVREQLELAFAGADDETVGLVLPDLSGLLLYGAVAGAADVVRIHVAAGDGIAHLLEVLLASDAGRAARLIVCELSDDAPFTSLLHALLTFGFLRAGTVEDYFEHGVSLEILVFQNRQL